MCIYEPRPRKQETEEEAEARESKEERVRVARRSLREAVRSRPLVPENVLPHEGFRVQLRLGAGLPHSGCPTEAVRSLPSGVGTCTTNP